MRSKPDDISSLSGIELLNQKCEAIIITGGTYMECGCDNNFNYSVSEEYASYFFNNCKDLTCDIIIITNKQGTLVTTGHTIDKNDYIYPIFEATDRTCGTKCSWDVFNLWAWSCYDKGTLNENNLRIESGYYIWNDNNTSYFSPNIDGDKITILRTSDDEDLYINKVNSLL